MRSITCPTLPGRVRWVSSEVTIITVKASGTVQIAGWPRSTALQPRVAAPVIDAREALVDLGYDVLATVVPRREVYAQSFGVPIKQAGCEIWLKVARDLIERCAPLCGVRS